MFEIYFTRTIDWCYRSWKGLYTYMCDSQREYNTLVLYICNINICSIFYRSQYVSNVNAYCAQFRIILFSVHTQSFVQMRSVEETRKKNDFVSYQSNLLYSFSCRQACVCVTTVNNICLLQSNQFEMLQRVFCLFIIRDDSFSHLHVT